MRWSTVVILSVFLVAACNDSKEPSPDANLTPDADITGTFSVSWTITDGQNALQCDDIAALSVSMDYVQNGGLFGSSETFNCASGSGTTRGILPGEYDLTFHIAGTVGDLEATPITMSRQAITTNGNVTLDPIEFTVVPRGGISFRLSADESGGNCAAVPAPGDGAAITKFQFELQDASGTCVPATFQIGDSDTVTADCNTPAVANSCIENDVVWTIDDIPSGQHRLSVIGFRDGDLPCYTADSQLAIPGGNYTRDFGTITVRGDQTQTECFPEQTR